MRFVSGFRNNDTHSSFFFTFSPLSFFSDKLLTRFCLWLPETHRHYIVRLFRAQISLKMVCDDGDRLSPQACFSKLYTQKRRRASQNLQHNKRLKVNKEYFILCLVFKFREQWNKIIARTNKNISPPIQKVTI